MTFGQELVINYTSSDGNTLVNEVEEVIKMMEFLLTMAVIALVFIVATIVVALLAGGLMKLKNTVFDREAENTSPE